MNKTELLGHLYDFTQASDAITAELKKLYPTGTWWAVKLRHGQRNPSIMQVIAHGGGRYGEVRFAMARKRSVRRIHPGDRTIKSVAHNDILYKVENPTPETDGTR